MEEIWININGFPEYPAAKLDELQVKQIKSLLATNNTNESMRKIAIDFNVSFRTIENIKYKSHWVTV